MQVELIEIRDHLSRFAPFDELPDEVLDGIARQVQVGYFKSGSHILEHDQPVADLHYIRSGAVDIHRRNGELYNRLTEGDIFAQAGLLRGNRVRFPAQAIEDTLIYFIPSALFHQLCEQHDNFSDFVDTEGQSRLKSAADSQASESVNIKVRKLLSRLPATLPMDASIQQAAVLMTEQGASALIIVDPHSHTDPRQQRMVGIITDRDFRTRVIAEGLSADTPLSAAMSPEPITLQLDDSVFEATLCMLRHNIHHLPVMHRQRPVGVITLADIIKYESQSSLYLVNTVSNRQSVAELQALLPDVRATFVRMAGDDLNSHMIGSTLSSVGRSFIQRLLELGETQLGPPPIPYCFMVMGSMARDEQLIVTDQDNALVLDDSFDPEQHDAYFLQLASFVSDGLAACGYTYCKGKIMATNQQWRQPLKVWKRYFSRWIEQPNPETLLHSNIFFDLAAVAGEADFAEQLKDVIAEKASRNEQFLALMARNALNRTPPLGFFRTFVMEKDGEQNNVINIKRRGTAPLTDLIRVHALACGSREQNSFERLDAIAATKLMPPESIDRLRYALELLSMSRIRHQALDIQQGREPDNNIEPENVSAAERHGLKDAFQILSNAQKFLRYRYPALRVTRPL
ncbi:CBS domain-containing protein [Halopseudomonas litoralis]|uniref:CBS domain-containing protein n=1 Tax=Halopseudomonas litoralis TaxID=797277 RepID=A0A1H1Y608_9GAMM|nr:DUF294 nucleotidyltransferase-like domain-containing protein [Halopseudomonas litoralis]SDT16948.1 CBS domain-containing protein [Halopseudomonas litoralis]